MVNNIYEKYLKNKKILIFGHSGFVGSWLALTLSSFKSNVLGVSLKMPNQNCISNRWQVLKSIIGVLMETATVSILIFVN